MVKEGYGVGGVTIRRIRKVFFDVEFFLMFIKRNEQKQRMVFVFCMNLSVSSRRGVGPITQEEWQAQQSVIRRVLDPTTGRTRLIKGDGEVLEEIVSRDKQRSLNKEATRADGNAFEGHVGLH
uniref:ADP-ribosylation factor-like protein 6-interacting protein 4 n=1 Tax=Eptatretus burgeri TaxID=7764 RepID=A0A8C4Q6V8_EPTBU